MLRLTHWVGGIQRPTYVPVQNIVCVQQAEKFTQVHITRGPQNAALVVNAIEPAEEVVALIDDALKHLADACLYKMFSGEALSAFETRIIKRIAAMMDHRTIKGEAELVRAAEEAGTAGAKKYIDKLAGEMDAPRKTKNRKGAS